MCKDAQRGAKRGLDPLDLELQVIVNHSTWILGTDLKSSARAANILNL